jgi:CHASE2 domain-containing sensor protein
MSIVEVHLQIINAALHGEFLRERSPVTNLFIIAMTGVLAFALCFLVRHPGKRFFSFVGLCVGYVVFARLLFDHAGKSSPWQARFRFWR